MSFTLVRLVPALYCAQQMCSAILSKLPLNLMFKFASFGETMVHDIFKRMELTVTRVPAADFTKR